MYQLKAEKEIKDGVTYYSSFACTCDELDKTDYQQEFLRIINEMSVQQYGNFDEILPHLGYLILDEINIILDELGFRIAEYITDQWFMMTVCNRDESVILNIEFDQFIFGFVDLYNIVKSHE